MNINELSIASMRATCIDMINKAKSGHPGMALGSAPILYTLFTKHLISDPQHPTWINRDRFVLSAGHASALLYTTLHLAGYEISMNDLKQFRQFGSLTPGHPEFGHTPGVDATSGPLGQGIAQAVGIAMAERSLRAMYPEGERLVSHYTYVLCGDGCLQEGLSQEAISLAGHQHLNKLILLYDSNAVTLDGSLDLSFSENVKMRFEASEWNVIEVSDGNDDKAIDKAIRKAKKSISKPTLIIVHTIIGFGSKNQGLSKTHGSPLGEEDGKAAKASYGYHYDNFTVPQEVYDHFRDCFMIRGRRFFRRWRRDMRRYAVEHQEAYDQFQKVAEGDVSSYLFKKLPEFPADYKDSTRNISGKILNQLHREVPVLIGGSADVAGSVMTKIEGGTPLSYLHPEGRDVNFGIREFAMASAANGMLLHGGLRPYVGCFLIFSDYMKSAIRMAALSHLPSIYLLSHDSIAVGEDGPTHQPIEQLAMLRSMPNLHVFRPCDARETASAWKLALLSRETPTAIVLSRQALPLCEHSSYEGVERGGYVISKEKGGKSEFTIIATGSEVSLALEAQEALAKLGHDVRVVSMPCQERFLAQNASYHKRVLGAPYHKRIVVEMGSTFGWHRFAPQVMGIDEFGTSAPAKDAINAYGFTVDTLVDAIMAKLEK